MPRFRHRAATIAIAALLAMQLASASPAQAAREGFNDEYVFATTKSLNDAHMNPALKVTLIPVTVVLDVAFLPFAVVAGFVT